MKRPMPQKSKEETLNDMVDQLQAQSKLTNWNAFIRELKVPNEIMPALLTMRPELIKVAPVRDLPAAEVRILYDLIAGLIETNDALRQHAVFTAQLVNQWGSSFKALQTLGLKVQDFANFRHMGTPAEDDGE